MRRGETGSSGSICPNSTHEARALRCSLAGLAASGPGRVLLSVNNKEDLWAGLSRIYLFVGIKVIWAVWVLREC
jgi:hypothetical protein